MAITIF